MALVQTTRGLVEETLLSVETREVENLDNSITMAREWSMNGETVRRDVWVTIKRGHEAGAEKGM